MTHRCLSVSRRTFLTSTVGGLVSLGVLTPSSAMAHTSARQPRLPADSWTQYGSTAAKTGSNPAASGPKADPTVRWTHAIAENERLRGIVGTDKTVYFCGGHYSTDIDDKPAIVRALSTDDGSVTWTFQNGGVNFYTGLAIDSSHVYTSSPHRIIALDANTGTEQWRFPPPKANRQLNNILQLTIADGTLYVTAASGQTGAHGADNEHSARVYALDGATGNVLWTYGADTTPADQTVPSGAAVRESILYVASNKLRAIDAQTGNQSWAITGKQSYQSYGQNIPAIADRHLYVGYGEKSDTFEARHTADGSRTWAYTVSAPDGPVQGRWTSASIANDTVVVGFQQAQPTKHTRLFALSQTDGTLRWQHGWPGATGTAVIPTPAIADGVVYVGTQAFALADGRLLWTRATENTPWLDCPPAVIGDTVYHLSEATVHAISGQTSFPSPTSKTTTPTPTSSDTATATPPSTPAVPTQTATDAATATPLTATATPTPTTPSTMTPTMAERTTATDGPGFGVLAAIGGIGFCGWRSLTHE
jgi:outer membrane protein assembly factor BamB